MLRKFLFLLTVCAAMVAQADVSQDQLWFSWNNDLDGYSVRARSDVTLEGVLEIPEWYNGHYVVEIPNDAFNPQGWYNGQHPKTTGITKVVLPEHLLKIGDFAFYKLTNLTEVDMSHCVNAEDFGGKSIFKDCSSLTNVMLPNNTVNTKLKRIAPGMFCGTPLTTITLPYSVSEIGYGAFKDCHSLETIYQYPQQGNASPARNQLFVNVIEHHAFDCSTNNGTNQLTSITFIYRDNGNNGQYVANPNLVIQNSAFRGNTNLASVNINGPYGVIVGDYAFDRTAITSFPNGQMNVGYRAFPTSLKFNDPLYNAESQNYANSYVYGTTHDKYSHVYNNTIQYLYNTRTYNFKQWNGQQLASNVPVLDIPQVNSDLAPQCKRLGYVVDGANTTADNLAVEPLTSMIDGYALRGSNYKTLTLNTDGELKYIESGAFGSMKNLRELTLPSSVKRFGAGSYGANVLYWGVPYNLDYGGYGVGSSGWGIAHDTPVMAYLDMSTVDKSAFASWWEEDEFSVGASLFNGTDTYRSNSGWYWQNCFDGMYEPTLVYLPSNTEDKWNNEDFEVYGRNFIFTNAGETPYCHLYETYDYDLPYGQSNGYLGHRNYYAIPHDFKAETAKYNRNFKKGLMYTVCIPFAVDAGKYGTFYEPSRYDGTTLYVKPISGETTQPRVPYVFIPNADYTTLEANNVMVSNIPDGFVETKVATGTGVYVEDEVAFPDEESEVMAKLCGLYETHQFGIANQDAHNGNGNNTNYGVLKTDGTIIYRAESQGALLEYPYHAAIWAKNKNFTKIVPEGDGRPEITGVYRSTFDVENVENDYSNSVRLVNPETQPMLADQFSTGTTMLINRVDHKGDSHVIANIAITGKDATTLNYRLTMTNGGNEQTGTFSIDAGNVVNFNDLTVEDEFSASTATNEHIGGYDYQLTMIDAKGNDIKTNVVEVPIYKTRYLATGAGFTYSQVYADKDHSMSLRKAVPAEMRMYSDAAITGYELLRNKQTVGSSAEKADGSSTYVVGGYGLNNGEIEWMNNLNEMEVTDEDGWLMVDMQDAIDPEEGTTVNYLPRISAKTTDFDGTTVINNTYGGVENNIVACDVQIEVKDAEKGSVFSDEENKLGYGPHYQGYAATVKLKAVLPNDDYQVYMYRLWRVLPDGTEKLLNDYSSTYANNNYEGHQWGSNYTALQKTDLEIEIRDVYLFTSIADLGGQCPTQYIARLYARTPKPAAQAPRGNRIPSTGYDAAEKTTAIDFANNDIPTAIESIKADGVKSVTYYNAAGVASSTPFDGLNVVVTVKADGTRKVTKMVK